MSSSTLPAAAAAFADATWDDIAPYYEALATRPLDRANVEAWLADWSALDALLDEAEARAEVEYTVDTTDAAKEARQLRFASEIGPQRGEQRVRLAGRLLDLGYERPGLETTVRHFRNSRELFREANVALGSDLQRLNSQYQKITGGMLAEWEGERKPLPQLAPFLPPRHRRGDRLLDRRREALAVGRAVVEPIILPMGVIAIIRQPSIVRDPLA